MKKGPEGPFINREIFALRTTGDFELQQYDSMRSYDCLH